ncbi:dihydrofolate reductase family protein [Arthrobacter roseus]|uniref:dihydrofolate reductase family protein n=1 Tax=Arthrobacter roseus TaxID=136274 RepID=UPI001966B276|nr:dihydrofolate reductase family protein [Arthrobacter roseus]MBM7847383.1 dihydrofolate reductase [Arthrobacter roseus]
MRELVYFVAVSLDGYIAAPDGSFGDFPIEGDHVDMILRDYTDTLPSHVLSALALQPDNARFDTVLMGWNTYAAGFPHGVRNPYPHLRQYVFSRSETEAAADIVLTAEDPVAVVKELKAEDSGADIWLCGGGQLAGALRGELDRLILKVNPVLLGAGIPLFAGQDYMVRSAELTSSTAFQSGVVVNEYRFEK